MREVRGLGLLWALELGRGRGPGRGGAAEAPARRRCAAQHLHLHKRDNMVFLAPPLVVSEAELDAGAGHGWAAALDEAFA